jgi:DNA-binding HxlR family transcriptional regulator
MPGFVKSKYSTQFSAELRVLALSVLSEAPRAMTIEEICGADTALIGITTQKMARTLNELVEAGFVIKTKSKLHGNRMVYTTLNKGKE